MDPLRDPLHDSVLDEALADTGLTTASTTEMAATSAIDGRTAEAEEDRASEAGSALSTLTAAMEAADRSPSTDRGPGVRHPLARLYIPGLLSELSERPPTLLHGPLGTARGPRPPTTTPAGSSSSARGPPTAPHMPGEPDDAYWQRAMAVNVLNTLQHTGPAFVHAPTLAMVRSWNSLRIILEEATEMDEVCCQS